MGVGRFVYTPILPGMLREAPLTAREAGLIAAANFAGYLIGALAAATGWARAGRPLVLVVALAASALTTGAMAAVDGAAAFAAIRFVSGLASAFAFVGATAIALEALARRGRLDLQALHYAGVGCGVAASALLVTATQAAGGGWRAQWLVCAAASALAAVFVALAAPRDPPPPPRAEAAAARKPGFWPICVAYGLFGFGYVVTATFLVTIVREAGGQGEALVWLVVGVAAAPSILVWNWVAGRIGVGAAFALACLAEAAGVAASVLWQGLAGALFAAALLGGTFMGITALGLAAARRTGGGEARRIVAVMTASFGLGQIVGPVVAGALREATGSYLAPSLAAAAALLVAAALGKVSDRG